MSEQEQEYYSLHQVASNKINDSKRDSMFFVFCNEMNRNGANKKRNTCKIFY